MSSRVGALSGRSEPAVLVPGLRQLALRTRALAAWAGAGSRADDELLPEQMTIASRAGGEHVPSRCRADPQGTGTVAAARRESPEPAVERRRPADGCGRKRTRTLHPAAESCACPALLPACWLPRPTCPACLPALLPAGLPRLACPACLPALLPAGSPACRPAPAGLACLPGRPGTLSSRSGHRARGLQLRHQVIRVVQLGTFLI